LRHVDRDKSPDDAKQREAEIADAKESLKAKLDAMAERARRTPGLRGVCLVRPAPTTLLWNVIVATRKDDE
jgi:hypothetical protein